MCILRKISVGLRTRMCSNLTACLMNAIWKDFSLIASVHNLFTRSITVGFRPARLDNIAHSWYFYSRKKPPPLWNAQQRAGVAAASAGRASSGPGERSFFRTGEYNELGARSANEGGTAGVFSSLKSKDSFAFEGFCFCYRFFSPQGGERKTQPVYSLTD